MRQMYRFKCSNQQVDKQTIGCVNFESDINYNTLPGAREECSRKSLGHDFSFLLFCSHPLWLFILLSNGDIYRIFCFLLWLRLQVDTQICFRRWAVWSALTWAVILCRLGILRSVVSRALLKVCPLRKGFCLAVFRIMHFKVSLQACSRGCC